MYGPRVNPIHDRSRFTASPRRGPVVDRTLYDEAVRLAYRIDMDSPFTPLVSGVGGRGVETRQAKECYL